MLVIIQHLAKSYYNHTYLVLVIAYDLLQSYLMRFYTMVQDNNNMGKAFGVLCALFAIGIVIALIIDS